MTNSPTKNKNKKKPEINKVGELINSTAVLAATPRNMKQDEMDLLIARLEVAMKINNKSLDEALEFEGLSRKSIPMYVYKKVLKQSISAKRELFDISSEDRAGYVRAADFETYMKAVESGDTDTQATFSKILRQDNELGMEAKAPSLMLNLGALKELLTGQDNSDIIEAEIIEPEPKMLE